MAIWGVDWRHGRPGWKRPPWLQEDEQLPPKPRAKSAGPVVIFLILSNMIIALVLMIMSNVREWTLERLAFTPAQYRVAGMDDWSLWIAPISHQFVHGYGIHFLISLVLLFAFASTIERVVGSLRMLLLYLLAGAAGAFVHFALFPTSTVPVVGASGSISGLFGALLVLMRMPKLTGPLNLRPWQAVLMWVGFSVAASLTTDLGLAGGQVAWAAHVGGFFAGVMIMMWWTRPRGPFSAVA